MPKPARDDPDDTQLEQSEKSVLRTKVRCYHNYNLFSRKKHDTHLVDETITIT